MQPSVSSRPERRRGHNLLELMVACMILSTVLILITGLWSVYHSALSKSRNMLVGSFLARSVLEQRMSAGYSSYDATLGVPQTSQIIAKSQVRGRLIEVPIDIEFTATATNTPGIRRLVAKLSWPEAPGVRTIRYETFLFRTE